MAERGELDTTHIHGVDKDRGLVRLAQLQLALLFDTLFPIQCADSLLWSDSASERTATRELAGSFTLVLTNPPFGSKIVALSGDSRGRFEIAIWNTTEPLEATK